MNGFTGLARGLRYSFNLSGYRTDAVVLHEIAHHFTLDYRVPDVPEAVGVGWLYFNHRVKGHCDVGEIYADLLTYYTRNKPSPGLGYLYGCNRIAKNGVPDKESKEVAGSVAEARLQTGSKRNMPVPMRRRSSTHYGPTYAPPLATAVLRT